MKDYRIRNIGTDRWHIMSTPPPEPSLSMDKKRMLQGTIFLTLSPVTAFFLGLVISLLINDLVPATDYGIFTWFNLMSSFIMNLIPFQLYGSITRYIAVSKGANNEETTQALLKTNSLLTLVLVPLSGFVALMITPIIFNSIPGVAGQYSLLDLSIFVLGIMALILANFIMSALKGLQEFNKIGLAQFAANTVGQALVIIILVYGVAIQGITSLGIQALLIKWVIVGLLTTIILTLSVRELWTLHGKTASLKPLLEFAYPMVLSFLFAFFFSEFLVRYFLNFFGVYELGLYGFAVRMVTFVSALTIGFYTALSSYYAQAYGKSDREKLEMELRWTLKISFFLFLPLILGVMVISPSFFLMLLPNYYWAYQYFIILMAQIFLLLFSRPYSLILNALAKTQTVLIVEVISSVLSGVLMFLFFIYAPLIVLWGLIDNALLLVVLGYASSGFFAFVLYAMVIRRYVGINLGLRQVLPLVLIGLCIFPPAVLIHILYLPPLYEFALIVIISTLIYLLPIRYFRVISEAEIRKASQFLPKRFSRRFANILVFLFVRNSSP
jgi:O-antigen/teichoic acid export membrane protein